MLLELTRLRTAETQQLRWPRWRVRLGRGSNADLRIHSGMLARVHCEIRRSFDWSLLVRDLETTNGTVLRGAKISAEAPLTPGEELFFGEHQLRVWGEPCVDPEVLTRGQEALRSLSCQPAVLEELAELDDRALVAGVAQHPNTPPLVLARLRSLFPRQVEANPAWSLALLADPMLARRS